LRNDPNLQFEQPTVKLYCWARNEEWRTDRMAVDKWTDETRKGWSQKLSQAARNVRGAASVSEQHSQSASIPLDKQIDLFGTRLNRRNDWLRYPDECDLLPKRFPKDQYNSPFQNQTKVDLNLWSNWSLVMQIPLSWGINLSDERWKIKVKDERWKMRTRRSWASIKGNSVWAACWMILIWISSSFI
jgi:hypothetical protein